MLDLNDSIPERVRRLFWDRVTRGTESECWMWTGGTGRRGYGRLHLGPRNRPTAHRISYVIHHGPIPAGMFVCHSCDIPGCVNPHHLFVGTHADNMADRSKKGRCAAWKQKLTAKDVEEIRRKYIPRKYSLSRLGSEYGVTASAIWAVVHFRTFLPSHGQE